MAARTPRKRKQRSASADGRCSSFGTPVKKLMVDCFVAVSPLQSRNPNSSSAIKRSPAPNYTAIGDPKDKENMAASPQKSSAARKLIVSPLLTEPGEEDAYVFSPLTSPNSSPKGAVSAKSFYKKASAYVTPVERKLIRESKGRNASSPGEKSGGKEPAKFTKVKKLPTARKRNSTSSTAPVKRESKTVLKTAVPKKKSAPPPEKKSKALPAPEQTETSPKEPVVQKSAILGLKMKPRPKLTMGAAFFATSKRPHPAPRRLPPHIKLPATSKPSFRPINENVAPKVKPDATDSDQKVAAGGGQKRISACVLSIGVKSESEGHKGAGTKGKSPTDAKTARGASRQEEDSALVGTNSESQIMFDADDLTLKTLDKKDSSLYPIFSTPSMTKKRPLDFRGELMSPVCSSSPLSAAPALNKVPKPSKRKDVNKMADDQLIIDAGQKHFGPVSCGACGMIYSASSAEDEAQHAQYHQRLLESIRYVGWKKERVAAEFWDGKILVIYPDDPKYALRKAEEVRELVDAELGFQQSLLSSPSRTRTYLYVTNDKKIVGCLIAEPIKQAFRVLAEPSSPEAKATSALERHRAWRCSSEAQPAICGISRIWVFALMRRRSIASRLVDTLRSSFIYGSRLTTDEIAFSDPTPDGKLFASRYCRVPDFLVYNFLS